MKRDKVAIVCNPSTDPLKNAAGVAPPLDHPGVKSAEHFAEYMRRRGEEFRLAEEATKKAGEDAKKRAERDMLIE